MNTNTDATSSIGQGKNAASAKDRPWLIRTYAGHSSAAKSNALYRKNLEKGQTGLSVAFDLPTQTGYDSDHPLVRGEVGKVGVPICHIGDMETLFDNIPLAEMNTSMTINAPAAWLLALYIATAERQGTDRAALAGTIQNDIIKEYLSRGTYIFPPQPALRLIVDTVAFCTQEMPKWNPVNVCSYHLQEAGATPEQELSFALATALTILDATKASGQVSDTDFPAVVGRISFFVNAGMRFITEMCKMRAFASLWDEITQERYGITDDKMRRFRYGVQVNSLGLTEQQPENNVYRILLEMLAVTLSKGARARAVQLPAWNEALGLPRPWDQQWSLRLQQIVAEETDLLEYPDIFDGSEVIAAKVDALKAATHAELARIEEMGGAIAAVENSYMKRALVESNAARLAAIETGTQKVIGVNCYQETEPSPLTADEGHLSIDPDDEGEQIERLHAWRATRDDSAVTATLETLRTVLTQGDNIMEASIACAHAGVTGGEWADTLRGVYGEYRAPTGLSGLAMQDLGSLQEAREQVNATTQKLGCRPKILVGKPGLDGHSNGAEQIALRARDAGMEVVYEGIRLTPDEIADAALQENVHVVGVSILSGSHLSLVSDIITAMKARDIGDIPLVVGGIIPRDDADSLLRTGVKRVYTPSDFDLNAIVCDIARIAEETQP